MNINYEVSTVVPESPKLHWIPRFVVSPSRKLWTKSKSNAPPTKSNSIVCVSASNPLHA